MTQELKNNIITLLSTLYHDPLGGNIIEKNIVSPIVIREGLVGFALEFPYPPTLQEEELRKKCETLVKTLPGVGRVNVIITSSVENEKKLTSTITKSKIQNVRHILMVSSGKGGVGKSTLAVNLAVTLAKKNISIGLADMDIYGPSIPTMLQINTKPMFSDAKKMIPFKSYNVQTVSMGSLVEEDQAVLWRGPMVSKAIYQLLHHTAWENVDLLILDTPPGTGDVHISLLERYVIDAALLISTPQKVALQDTIKSLAMFRRLNVPLLGLVENMSYFKDPKSKDTHFIFGRKGGEIMAAQENIPFLGSIPLEETIRTGGDEGVPYAHHNAFHYFTDIAEKIVSFFSLEKSHV